MSELEVISFRRGPFWNFSYLVAERATARATVIDPAWDARAILDVAQSRGLTIESIVLTHSHSDHVNALVELLGAAPVAVFCHEDEATGVPEEARGQIEAIAGDGVMSVGSMEVALLHTPGHSPGSLSVLAGGRLFSGDTLLVGGVGRPGPGAVDLLWESVLRLRGLPQGTVLHPGHDEGPSPISTLGAEFEQVAALRAGGFGEFVRELERATGYAHHAPR